MLNNQIGPLRNFLKSIYAAPIVKNGGVILHASGILRRGEAHIFFGPSGSGKTTLASLSEEFTVLDDETIFIERKNARFQASGVRLQGSFPVKGLYKLTQDKRVYLKRVKPTQALSEIFTVPQMLKALSWHQRLLVNFSRLLAEVPCYELHFRRDGTFWKYL